MNIHLFRHGQVAGPAALYGKTDVALSEAGWSALSRATRELAPPDRIISSPRQRCLRFAAAKAKELHRPLEVMEGFREMDFGHWDGQPYDQHSPEWSAMERFWQSPPA